MSKTLTIGFARMHEEAGEKRDFMPRFMADLERHGYQIFFEYGLGSLMGLNEKDYLHVVPSARFVSRDEIYQKDYVVILRYPGDDLVRSMPPASCLISMLHLPTRPARVELMRSLGIEGLAIDMIKDDSGRRLVENLRSVGWNGVGVAFQLMRRIYPEPGFESPERPPIKVTVLGPGEVGVHAIQSAARYGDETLHHDFAALGIPGVRVCVLDYDLTGFETMMLDILKETDILIDATQRLDPAAPIIPNKWIQVMPGHAILLDLSVDPYNFTSTHYSVKGIEGIPQGNLDKYIFTPNDPAYNLIPESIDTTNRRHVIACYSWPGLYPKECMLVYGSQLRPILRTIIEAGGIKRIDPHGNFFHRAIARGMLSQWNHFTNGN